MANEGETSRLRLDTLIPREKKRDYVAQAKAQDKSLEDWILQCCDDAVAASDVHPAWARGLNVRTCRLLVATGFTSKEEVEAAMLNPEFSFQASILGWSRQNFTDLESWI